LEKIARLNRRRAGHRSWNGDDSSAVPARRNGANHSRAHNHESAQPDPGRTIELGLIGAFALIAMWLAHLALFRNGILLAWFGLLVVTYNIVSSLFNSHLFDFTQGWLYVFCVGLTGGMVLRAADVAAKAEAEHPSNKITSTSFT
jgi:hypothetical protein